MTHHHNSDFVLEGRRTPLWEKPAYLSNSDLSWTTRRLTQTSLYSPDNYRDLRNHGNQSLHPSMREPPPTSTPAVAATSEDIGMKKSVSFNKKHGGKAPAHNGNTNPVLNGMVNGDMYASSQESDYSGYSAKNPKEYQWFTKPVHLDKDLCPPPPVADNNDNTLSDKLLSPVEMPVGTLGAAVAEIAKPVKNGTGSHGQCTAITEKLSTCRLAPSDELARDFFPITLGAAHTLGSIDTSTASTAKSNTASSPAKGLKQPNPAPWKPRRSRSPSRTKKNRPGSAHSSSSSNSKSSLDKMYFMTAEAPVIGSSTVLLSSPYQHELARLRIERLRIEEAHLLEVKRKEELERIRGPQPKWYELKSPRFHYEAHKNTELIRNKESWQDLVDYRSELERASKQFHKTFDESL